MTWFKVDDSFHSHPKTAAVSLAAVGLWTLAGAWSGDHLTDGFVPDHMIPLLSRGSTELADALVVAGLWKRTRKGYQFHQWTQANPEASEVKALRAKRAQAGRAGGLASGKTRSKNEAKGSANAWGRLEPPTRPSPSTKEKGSDGARFAGAAPPTQTQTDPRAAVHCEICGNALNSAYHRNVCRKYDVA